MRWTIIVAVSLLAAPCNAQFGEIASLASSILGGALGNAGGLGALAGAGANAAGAAGQAGGALAQIGQLYQLAQGALQLTGTGVGVLNQASEGNWFPAVLEQAAKNQQALMKGGGLGGNGNGLNLGPLSPKPATGGGNAIGPEFGTSFPAPDIDDYDENASIPGLKKGKTPQPPDGLTDIDSEDNKPSVTEETTEEPVTLFPDNKEVEETEATLEPEEITTPPSRQIHVQLPDKNTPSAGGGGGGDEDYEDLINRHKTEPTEVGEVDTNEELRKNIVATHGAKNKPVPKLEKLVEVLQKSKLSPEEIDEIVSQVEGNKNIEKPPKFDFNSAVQNIPDKKNVIREKIAVASRAINEHLESQRQVRSKDLQHHVDELRVIPDIAQKVTTPAAPSRQFARSVPSPAQYQTQPPPPPPQPQPQPQPTPYPYYNQQYQQRPPQVYQQQTYQAPVYGQQNQQYWGQGYNYQQNGYQQQLARSASQNQQGFHQQGFNAQQVPQQPQQHYQQTVNQPQYYPQQPLQQVPQQIPQQAPQYSQQPAQNFNSNRGPLNVVQSNTNQVVHYYNDGHQIVQQIIPRNIAATGSFPLNGPFQSTRAAVTPTPDEYSRAQRELQQAYGRPETRSQNVPQNARYVNVSPQIGNGYQAPAKAQNVYETTVNVVANRHAHAIRTFQANDAEVTTTTGKPATSRQPSAPVRSSGKTTSSKSRISGQVLPGPSIDPRSLLEKRTTAKPRLVHLP